MLCAALGGKRTAACTYARCLGGEVGSDVRDPALVPTFFVPRLTLPDVALRTLGESAAFGHTPAGNRIPNPVARSPLLFIPCLHAPVIPRLSWSPQRWQPPSALLAPGCTPGAPLVPFWEPYAI